MRAFQPPDDEPATATRPASSCRPGALRRTQRTAAVASSTWAGNVPCLELRTENAATA